MRGIRSRNRGGEIRPRPRLAQNGRDFAGQHRNSAAGMREQPLDVAHLRESPADQKTENRARRIVRHFDHRRERADVEPVAAARDQRMDVNDRFAPVQLRENRPVRGIAEPFISVIGL